MQHANFHKIYSDILEKKYPGKKDRCVQILQKKNLSAWDILKLNSIIFENTSSNSQYRSYKKSDILQTLDYQKNNKLNNTEISKLLGISRNTVSKWKKKFI